MNLKKEKETKTEIDYCMMIELLSFEVTIRSYDIISNRISDKSGTFRKKTTKMWKDRNKLFYIIYKKFGVISPKDCPEMRTGEEYPSPPRGKIYYWEWYKKIKEKVQKEATKKELKQITIFAYCS